MFTQMNGKFFLFDRPIFCQFHHLFMMVYDSKVFLYYQEFQGGCHNRGAYVEGLTKELEMDLAEEEAQCWLLKEQNQ